VCVCVCVCCSVSIGSWWIIRHVMSLCSPRVSWTLTQPPTDVNDLLQTGDRDYQQSLNCTHPRWWPMNSLSTEMISVLFWIWSHECFAPHWLPGCKDSCAIFINRLLTYLLRYLFTSLRIGPCSDVDWDVLFACVTVNRPVLGCSSIDKNRRSVLGCR